MTAASYIRCVNIKGAAVTLVSVAAVGLIAGCGSDGSDADVTKEVQYDQALSRDGIATGFSNAAADYNTLGPGICKDLAGGKDYHVELFQLMSMTKDEPTTVEHPLADPLWTADQAAAVLDDAIQVYCPQFAQNGAAPALVSDPPSSP